MDFLVEELDRIIGDLTNIRDNLKNGIDLRRMKELCAERRLALERYRLEYAFNNPPPRGASTSTSYGHPINRSYPDDYVAEDEIG